MNSANITFTDENEAMVNARQRADAENRGWSILIDTLDETFYLKPSSDIESDEVCWTSVSPRPFPVPQCDKLEASGDAFRHISEFIEWLSENEPNRHIHLTGGTTGEDLIYQFLGIDPGALEKERRALLQ